MYYAACKVEFQPFKRLYSQLTFFNFLLNNTYQVLLYCYSAGLWVGGSVRSCGVLLACVVHGFVGILLPFFFSRCTGPALA